MSNAMQRFVEAHAVDGMKIDFLQCIHQRLTYLPNQLHNLKKSMPAGVIRNQGLVTIDPILGQSVWHISLSKATIRSNITR